jgi:hypothetical protein
MVQDRLYVHRLVDRLNDTELAKLFNMLDSFIPVDNPLPDELEAIEYGRQAYERGEYTIMTREDWDKRTELQSEFSLQN